MSKIFTKKNVMPVVVLTAICLVVAALIGAVNIVTRDVIAEAERAAIAESLKTVMPEGSFGDAEELAAGAPESVTAVYKDKNGGGYVVTLVTYKGYEGKGISITVGIDNEGKIIKAVITNNTESKDKDKSNAYPDEFAGLSAGDISGVELISGVTYSSAAIKNAINDALVVTGFATAEKEEAPADKGVSALTDSDVIAIAGELSGGSYEKTEISGMPAQVIGVYCETSGNGYALHIATRTQWRPLETDGVVTVDKMGTVTGVKMVEWIVGYDQELLDKAPECDQEFINSIIGKREEGLSRVDLVTHATNTSNNFINPLREALDILYPTPIYTIIGCIIAGVAIVLAAVVVIIKKRRIAK